MYNNNKNIKETVFFICIVLYIKKNNHIVYLSILKATLKNSSNLHVYQSLSFVYPY